MKAEEALQVADKIKQSWINWLSSRDGITVTGSTKDGWQVLDWDQSQIGSDYQTRGEAETARAKIIEDYSADVLDLWDGSAEAADYDKIIAIARRYLLKDDLTDEDEETVEDISSNY